MAIGGVFNQISYITLPPGGWGRHLKYDFGCVSSRLSRRGGGHSQSGLLRLERRRPVQNIQEALQAERPGAGFQVEKQLYSTIWKTITKINKYNSAFHQKKHEQSCLPPKERSNCLLSNKRYKVFEHSFHQMRQVINYDPKGCFQGGKNQFWTKFFGETTFQT